MEHFASEGNKWNEKQVVLETCETHNRMEHVKIFSWFKFKEQVKMTSEMWNIWTGEQLKMEHWNSVGNKWK